MIALIVITSNNMEEASFLLQDGDQNPKLGHYSVCVINVSDEPITVQVNSVKAAALDPGKKVMYDYDINDRASSMVYVWGNGVSWMGACRPSEGRSLSVNTIVV